MNLRSIILWVIVVLGQFSVLEAQYDRAAAMNGVQGQPKPAGYVIYGKVLDSVSLKPLSMVAIEVSKLGAVNSVDGGLTDTSGIFRIMLRGEGIMSYIIKFTAVGYPVLLISDTIRLSPDKMQFNCGSILLASPTLDYETMDAAVIKVSGPVVENKIDRLVYNAGQGYYSQRWFGL